MLTDVATSVATSIFMPGDYSAQGRDERVTSKDRLKRLEEGVLTLAQRREDTPDAAVCLGANPSAVTRHQVSVLKGAGY